MLFKWWKKRRVKNLVSVVKSTETKFCKDCKHCFVSRYTAYDTSNYRCRHPLLSTHIPATEVFHLVTGEDVGIPAHVNDFRCGFCREAGQGCGPEGKLWEGK